MERLQELAQQLAIPGLPPWTGLVALLCLALVLLAWVVMPFSVFGVKTRLEMLEAQLEDIQAEIRALGMRLAEQPRPGVAATAVPDYLEMPAPRRAAPAEPRATPPVPPPAARPEPRLDWPSPAGR